jgi:hypothetical protein
VFVSVEAWFTLSGSANRPKRKSYWHSPNGHAVLEIPLHEPEFELGVQ